MVEKFDLSGALRGEPAKLGEADRILDATHTGSPVSQGVKSAGNDKPPQMPEPESADGPQAPALVGVRADVLEQLLAEVKSLRSEVRGAAPQLRQVGDALVADTRPFFVQLAERLNLSTDWPTLIANLEQRAKSILSSPGSDEWKKIELEFLGAFHAVARVIQSAVPADHQPHNDIPTA